MAETFPISGFERIGLQVVSGIKSVRTRGGLVITGRAVEPRWTGRFTTDKLDIDEWRDLAAFLTDCVDRNLRVDFIHPRHVVPAGYTLESWPVLVDPVLVSVTNRRLIIASGLTLGVVLQRGVRVSLMQSGLICHRMIAADTVVTSTVAQALPLTPRLPIGVFTADALVRFKQPPIRLAIVPDSYVLDEEFNQTPISFDTEEALQ